MTEPQTTGTAAPHDGDAAGKPTTGTVVDAGRDAEAGLSEDQKKLLLVHKEKAERANALEKENQDLKAQLAERTQPPPAPAGAAGDDEMRRQTMDELRRLAPVDPVSRALLWNMERDNEREREIVEAFQIRDLPVEERAEVTKHYLANRHRFGDPLAARADLKASKFETENAELRAKVAQLDKKPDAAVANAVPTLGRETNVTAGKTMKDVPIAQFDAEIAELEAQGRGHEAMLRKGEIGKTINLVR